MSIDPEKDSDLVAIDASHLFKDSITKIGFRKGTFLRGFMYDFIARFAPHLDKAAIDRASQCHSKAELEDMFKEIQLPNR